MSPSSAAVDGWANTLSGAGNGRWVRLASAVARPGVHCHWRRPQDRVAPATPLRRTENERPLLAEQFQATVGEFLRQERWQHLKHVRGGRGGAVGPNLVLQQVEAPLREVESVRVEQVEPVDRLADLCGSPGGDAGGDDLAVDPVEGCDEGVR